MDSLLTLVALATVGVSAAVGHALDKVVGKVCRKIDEELDRKRAEIEELQEQALPPGWGEAGADVWQGIQARRAFGNREEGEA